MDTKNINFVRVSAESLSEMLPYFRNCRLHLSDYSCAHKFMWQKHYTLVYAYVGKCLVFGEKYMGRVYFHYPLSLSGDEGEETAALDMLEEFCREKFERLHYTNIPRERLMLLVDRYGAEARITNSRRWRDYLYEAQDFVTYAGKKFSGQRNHVNKFKKLYPDFRYEVLTAADGERIKGFLDEYAERQIAKGTVMAKEELAAVYALVPHINDFDMRAGALVVDGKIVALSIGEVCGDMLIIHVEKALTGYEGAYPMMAQQFAVYNVGEGIRYINREDDAGDAGLRKSKLQYNPVKLVDKFSFYPHRLIDVLAHIPVLQGERVTLKEITDADSLELYRLCYDDERNKYWGYDWRQDFKGEPTPEYFLHELRKYFSDKEEVHLGIYAGQTFVGEAVLHNFGYRNDCEVGVRLLSEHEGNGYAAEAVRLACNFALYEMNAEVVNAKCFRQNERSRKCLLAAGMREIEGDETYFRFIRTAAM